MVSVRFAFAIFFIVLLLSMIANLAIWYYIAYTKKAEMLGYLSNCRQIRGKDASTVKGKWGHLFMMGDIGNILMFPKLSVRKWGADAGDISRFPTELRRVIVLSQKITLIQLLCLATFAAVVKCTDWVK